jgi:elongation factor P
MVKITTSDFNVGGAIVMDGDKYLIIKVDFVNPGKGSAFYKVKLRNLRTGNLLENTFKSGETVQQADLRYKDINFLYKDKNNYYFMDENYEQEFLSSDVIGDREKFLKEGLKMRGIVIDGNLFDIILPTKVDYKVIEAPPGIKGDSVSSATKFVTIETEAKISVPLFVKQGDIIKVNTETGDYVERVRE